LRLNIVADKLLLQAGLDPSYLGIWMLRRGRNNFLASQVEPTFMSN
jgi:hypothetical protein